MGHRENYGILGIPLHHSAASEFKLSAQNRIAPTPIVYAKLKQREISKEERNLLENTSVLAAKSNNLYLKDGGCFDGGELMDEEDKAHFRLQGTIKRNKMHESKQGSLQQTETSSFLAKSVEIPDIAPKLARTAHGSGLLQRTYSIRPNEEWKFEPKAYRSALRTPCLYASSELQREPRKGLGYRDDEEPVSKSGVSRVGQASHGRREKDNVHAFEAATRFDYDDSEDEYELANAGYKDLDSTAKLLSKRLQESRGNRAGKTNSKKRFAGNWTGALEERVWFSQFSQSQMIDALPVDWTENEIPSSFAADPAHRFETDSMKTTMPVMSELIRQEYVTSLKLCTENRKKESEASRVAITKAKEQAKAMSLKIRDLIVKDMGSRFIEPNELQTQEDVSRTRECTDQRAICESSTKESLKRGEAKRTNQSWKPESLLCKRLGVETGKLELISPKTKTMESGKLLSSQGDDEEFLIHSITPASAETWDFSDENILISDRFVGLCGYEGFNADINMCNYAVNKSPNPRLAKAIFTNVKIEDRSVEEPGDILSNDTRLRDDSKRNGHNRGVHKIRAVDFF